jgi:hypothetical protein
MIVESGLIVAAGLLFTFTKCSWSIRMKILSSPLFMDIIIFVLLNILHWGTFSGVMVAATGALICSGLITAGRYVFGHVDKNVYYPGVRNVADKLRIEK